VSIAGSCELHLTICTGSDDQLVAFHPAIGETTAFATGCDAPDAQAVTIVWLPWSGTSVRLREYPTADAGIPHNWNESAVPSASRSPD
jgi:hypothetical protein